MQLKAERMLSAEDIEAALRMSENDEQKKILSRFFKTGPGEYGEGDMFLGLKVPQTRAIVKLAKGKTPKAEIERLLYSKWHEVRLCGFLLLVEEMKSALPRKRETASAGALRRCQIAEFYLKHARQANNWDLVDLSSPYILGEYLINPLPNGELPSSLILDKLAASQNLWEQRIAIVSTLRLIRDHRFDETLRISKQLLSHPHDLIHKSVGWMLREMGKRDTDKLRSFLTEHYAQIPRTTLRYAIEKFGGEERKMWLKKGDCKTGSES